MLTGWVVIVEMNIHQVGVLEIKISVLIPFIDFISILLRNIRVRSNFPIYQLKVRRLGTRIIECAFVDWLQCSMFFLGTM